MTSVLAWHFLKADCRTGEGDILVKPGSVLHVDLPIEPCRRGLHGSRQAIDALTYAPGPVIERVELYGTIVEGDDKLVATNRRCLWLADATNVLHEFACRCAEDALRAAEVDDARCWSAIATKRAWLRGEADDKELDAARPAACPAAWHAAEYIARRVTAKDSVWDAAWLAMRTALRAATRAAGPHATWDAAWGAECARQNQRLTAMLSALKPKEVRQR